MKVIVKEPTKKAKLVDIENELEPMQKIVGGYIEVYPYKDNSHIICNEDGKLMGLLPNIFYEGSYIAGPIIVCGIDASKGEFTDVPITLEQFNEITDVCL